MRSRNAARNVVRGSALREIDLANAQSNIGVFDASLSRKAMLAVARGLRRGQAQPVNILGSLLSADLGGSCWMQEVSGTVQC